MKKYLLTALLGVFGLFGFASANTVDGFTSDSEIYSYTFVDSQGFDFSSLSVSSDFYVCFSTDDIPFYYKTYYVESPLINSSIYCSSVVNTRDDDSFEFYSSSDFTFDDLKSISGKMYYSVSPITYSSSEGGDSGDSLLPGGTTAFSGIISSLGSAVSEFIPYVAYIGIGLLSAIIGFVAIKRLINRVRAKIFGTFNSRRRK